MGRRDQLLPRRIQEAERSQASSIPLPYNNPEVDRMSGIS